MEKEVSKKNQGIYAIQLILIDIYILIMGIF